MFSLTVLAKHVNKVKFLVNDHSTTILTGLGVSGTVVTAVLTGRASFKAAALIEQEKRWVDVPEELPTTLSKTNKIKLTWHLFLPPVGVGITTITCIIVANKISSKQIAALAIASGVSERALQEYKEKVVEKLGMKEDQAIRDEIAQDRINKNPVGSEIILAGTGQVLCYDMTTGRYFQSTVEDIKRAENKINYELIHFMHASLSQFYDEIGLPPTSYSDSVGWNVNNHIEVTFSTTMSTDQRPCVAIDFVKQPVADYDRNSYD
jgi:hypothetical protein